MTGNDAIKRAMKELGALGIGETPSASEQSEGLTTLNAMLNSWNTERLNIFALQFTDFALTTATQAYTFGAGGAITTRPAKIESAAALIADAGGVAANDKVRLPIEIISGREWGLLKMQRALSTVPEKMYPDYAFPIMNVRFWPIPTFSGTAPRVEIYSWTILAAFTATGDTTLPPGYERAIMLNLAVELGPEYGRPVSEDLRRIAMEAKAAIQAFNSQWPHGDPPPPVGPVQVPPPGAAPTLPTLPPQRGA